MVLFLFSNIFLFELGSDFSQNRKYFVLKSSLCQFSNMASSGLQENVYIHNFYGVIGKKFFPLILLLEFLGWCYCLLWQMLKPLNS